MTMTDFTNKTWTLKSEPDADNNASVEFGCDGTTQIINIPDVSSVDAVTVFLNQYTLDYIAGLQQIAQATTNGSELSSLVNQPQTVPADPES